MYIFYFCVCLSYRYHGRLKSLRGSEGRPALYSHRNDSSHPHHLSCLYPLTHTHSHTCVAVRVNVFRPSRCCFRAIETFSWVRDADLSSVVLFGACVKGVLLRDKWAFFLSLCFSFVFCLWCLSIHPYINPHTHSQLFFLSFFLFILYYFILYYFGSSFCSPTFWLLVLIISVLPLFHPSIPQVFILSGSYNLGAFLTFIPLRIHPSVLPYIHPSFHPHTVFFFFSLFLFYFFVIFRPSIFSFFHPQPVLSFLCAIFPAGLVTQWKATWLWVHWRGRPPGSSWSDLFSRRAAQAFSHWPAPRDCCRPSLKITSSPSLE